ncbi:MAG TPA: 2-polyprenylphenol 6-hydroxylase [Alphaproteobacteria bacterium]|nr:2-polyprenylphenol 6-hydroxylase [Alphaproteobacteria bacterium]
MLRALRNILRLIFIARTLHRHGALAPIRDLVEELGIAPALVLALTPFSREEGADRPGVRLARAFVALGPTFIKLGQMLSTRADLVGEAIAADLSDLQDRLQPFPTAEARRIVADELGQPIDALFVDFADEPVSAASIAQVHFASTPDGQEVAVKVLRPGIEAAFARDLDLLFWVAGIVERREPRLKRLKPLAVARTFEETVRLEMDLRLEAAAAAELAQNFRGDETYRVPTVDWARTARRVLTLERIAGIPMDDRAALIAAGHEIDAVLSRAAAIFFNQVFRDGYFHGDQHPGNMAVAADGAIVAVDFGIMGRLDRATRFTLADMLLAFLDRDYRRLAEIHFEAGYVPATQSLDNFAQACRSIGEPIFGRALSEISFARLLGQLFAIGQAFDMEVQPQLLLLQKNMLMAEGVSRVLNPNLNIWTLAQPLIEEWMRENRGPEARLRDAMDDAVFVFQRLPGLLAEAERVFARLGKSGVRLHPETLSDLDRRDRRNRHRWIGWIVGLSLVAVAARCVLAG